MKLCRWLILTTLLTTASGCEVVQMFRAKKVFVGSGQYAEIAYPSKVYCWITNSETGKKELRIVEAQAGWLVGRQKGDPKTVSSGDR